MGYVLKFAQFTAPNSVFEKFGRVRWRVITAGIQGNFFISTFKFRTFTYFEPLDLISFHITEYVDAFRGTLWPIPTKLAKAWRDGRLPPLLSVTHSPSYAVVKLVFVAGLPVNFSAEIWK